MKKITGITESRTVEAAEIGEHIGETIRIQGSIYKVRKMSGFAFVLVRMRRTVVQCLYSPEYAGFSAELLKEESCITAETLSFDLLFRGVEITTGGQRIHCYRQQKEKMKARGMDVEAFESYLMMHRHGMPPHGGLGLGLERFTSRLLGQDNVRYASLFPRDISRVTP